MRMVFCILVDFLILSLTESAHLCTLNEWTCLPRRPAGQNANLTRARVPHLPWSPPIPVLPEGSHPEDSVLFNWQRWPHAEVEYGFS